LPAAAHALRKTSEIAPQPDIESWPASESEDAICRSLNVRGCYSLDNVCGTFSGGSNATARFHNGTWYCGYVAKRGPSGAAVEDEVDRFR
jgi:hypothetical protein